MSDEVDRVENCLYLWSPII